MLCFPLFYVTVKELSIIHILLFYSIFLATKMEDWDFMFVHFMAVSKYVVLTSSL